MSTESRGDDVLFVLVGLIAVVILAYSALIVQQILLGLIVGFWAILLYLAWRFVRAHERIAAALDADR